MTTYHTTASHPRRDTVVWIGMDDKRNLMMLMLACMRVPVLQDMKLYTLTDSFHVSQESTAYTIRVPSIMKMDVADYYIMLVTIYQTTWLHIKKRKYKRINKMVTLSERGHIRKSKKAIHLLPSAFSAFIDGISLSDKEEMVWDFEVIYNIN